MLRTSCSVRPSRRAATPFLVTPSAHLLWVLHAVRTPNVNKPRISARHANFSAGRDGLNGRLAPTCSNLVRVIYRYSSNIGSGGHSGLTPLRTALSFLPATHFVKNILQQLILYLPWQAT